jgi:hypothetical protein
VAYQDYPRPDAEPYYEDRHRFVTQGDIYRDVPWAQLGPTMLVVDPAPEGLAIPEGHIPMVSLVAISNFGVVLSDTCDFRHPRAQDIDANPEEFADFGSIYHSSFVRVAPIFAPKDFPDVDDAAGYWEEVRRFDHVRRLMYLPALTSKLGLEVMPISAIALHMSDSLHLQVIEGLSRVTQLTRTARQQLNRKIVLADTGFRTKYADFNPDLD